MALQADAPLGAPGDDPVGLLVAGLAADGLVECPVEAGRGVVEQLREALPVLIVEGLRPGGLEAEDVAAEEEVVAGLRDRHPGAGERFAGGIDDADDGIGLAVRLDGRAGRGEGRLLAPVIFGAKLGAVGQLGRVAVGGGNDREPHDVEVPVLLPYADVVEEGDGDLVGPFSMVISKRSSPGWARLTVTVLTGRPLTRSAMCGQTPPAGRPQARTTTA